MSSAASTMVFAMLGVVALGTSSLVSAKTVPSGIRASASSWSLPAGNNAQVDDMESNVAEAWADVLSVDPVYQQNGNSQAIVGYRVQYRYQGVIYAARLHHDPGNRLRVQVRVTPVE